MPKQKEATTNDDHQHLVFYIVILALALLAVIMLGAIIVMNGDDDSDSIINGNGNSSINQASEVIEVTPAPTMVSYNSLTLQSEQFTLVSPDFLATESTKEILVNVEIPITSTIQLLPQNTSQVKIADPNFEMTFSLNIEGQTLAYEDVPEFTQLQNDNLQKSIYRLQSSTPDIYTFGEDLELVKNNGCNEFTDTTQISACSTGGFLTLPELDLAGVLAIDCMTTSDSYLDVCDGIVETMQVVAN